MDREGKLATVGFVARDGQKFSSQATGPDGKVTVLPDGRDLFCWYNNGIGRDLCDAYRFDGRNIVQVDAWMSWEGGSDDIDKLIPQERAARALYDFLSALDKKKFQAAAYYFGGWR
jgi:hypothetical protein